MLKRIVFAAGLAASLQGAQAAGNEALPPVSLYAPAVCLACIDWADHLRKNGFTVTIKVTADMEALKRRLKVPRDVEAVPTAMVGGYFIEGHVPADDIKLLLKEKPRARGLAVPGLPMGAPGRESTGSDITCESGCTILEPGMAERPERREMYDTLLVGRDGKTSIYARH